MSTLKRNDKKNKSSTTSIYLKEVFWGLRNKLGFNEQIDDCSEASRFEALESRLLLSVNPLSELDERMYAGNQPLLNDTAVYMEAVVEDTVIEQHAYQPMSGSLAPAAGSDIGVLSAPTISVTYEGPENPKVGDTIVITVNATDTVEIIGYSLSVNNGGGILTLDDNASCSYTFTKPGSYIFAASAKNINGEIGGGSLRIKIAETAVDIEAPAVTISHNSPSVLNPGMSVDFSVIATDNVGVKTTTLTINGQEVALDASASASYTFTATGTYTIRATAEDAAGNSNYYEFQLTVTAASNVDTEAPTINIAHDGGSAITLGDTVNFTITAQDNVGVKSLVVFFNGQEVTLDANGGFSYAFTSAGSYSILAIATDAAGNTSQSRLDLTVTVREVAAPVVSITHDGSSHVIAGQTVNFNVAVTSEIAIQSRTMTINGQTIVIGANGSASYTFATAGIYYVNVSAIDIEGRVGSETLIFNVTAKADVEAPVVSLSHDAPGTIYSGQFVNFNIGATDNVGVTSRSLTINGVEITIDSNGDAAY